MEKPRTPKVGRIYAHDCDQCTYLGVWVRVGEALYFDLYYCVGSGVPVLQVRYGHESDQCYGSIAEAQSQERLGHDSPLVAALKIARQKGFISG